MTEWSVARPALLGCLVRLMIIETSAAAENISSRYMLLDEDNLMRGRFIEDSRKPRFLTFRTTDSDISVEMQLAIPFLSIPVKKTMEAGQGVLNEVGAVNLNMGALLLGGMIFLGAVFVVPAIMRFFSVTHVTSAKYRMFEGSPDDSLLWMERLERALDSKGLQPKECTARTLCSLVKRSMERADSGMPGSLDKMIDGIVSNNWIMDSLRDTVFHEAIVYGYTKQDCTARYARCKVNQSIIKVLASTGFV